MRQPQFPKYNGLPAPKILPFDGPSSHYDVGFTLRIRCPRRRRDPSSFKHLAKKGQRSSRISAFTKPSCPSRQPSSATCSPSPNRFSPLRVTPLSPSSKSQSPQKSSSSSSDSSTRSNPHHKLPAVSRRPLSERRSNLGLCHRLSREPT